MRSTNEYDVIVVGAGPAGLATAGEAARGGARVLVLDKRPEPSTLSRAFGVHARTLELLDQRGLADELVATGHSAPGLSLLGRTRLDLSALPTRFNQVLVTPQVNVDSLLQRWAIAMGANVVRGCEVTDVREEEVGIRVVGRTAEGERTWTGAYAVAADGVHSPTRARAGLPFPGEAVLSSVVLADVVLADPPSEYVAVDAVADAFAFVAPFGDGRYRVIAWSRSDQRDPDVPVTDEEVRRIVTDVMGTDFGWQGVTWTSRFGCDERQLADYRHGRTFFVGDAAHAHSPAGAQGMNTGIQDGLNLGWKLAAVAGGAPDEVLDSYSAERHPVGRQVLRVSGVTIRAMVLRSPVLRWLRDHVLPVVIGLPLPARRAAMTFSGLGIGYGHGRGEDALVGTRVPDLPLAGEPSRLWEAARAGGFLLVVEAGGQHPQVPTGVHVVERSDGGPALLVRPDGYAAWAGPRAAGPRAAGPSATGPRAADGGWTSVLRRWTGTPRRAVAADVS